MARIPIASTLTCQRCTHKDLVLELQKSVGEGEWLATLGFALLLERLEGTRSPWHPYLDSIPQREPNVLLSWSNIDWRRTRLKGTDIDQVLRDEGAAAREEWDKHITPLLSKCPKSVPGAGLTFEVCTASRCVCVCVLPTPCHHCARVVESTRNSQ